jgi:drug/metabolite transporter (DMT)-like permease
VVSGTRLQYRNSGLFGLYCVFGALVFIGAKLGLPYVPPILLAAFRLDIAGLVLLPIVGVYGEYWLPRTRRDMLGVVFTGVFTLGVMNTFLLTGQQYVNSAVGSIAYSLMPVLMTGFAVAILPTTSRGWLDAVGIGLGLVGVVVVASPTPSELLTTRVVGIGLMVSSVAIFALGSVLTQRLDPSMPRTALTAWGALLAGVFNHVVSFGFGESLDSVEWTLQTLYALFVLGVLATGILYVVHFELIDRIGPSRTSLNFYIQPIVASVIGLALFGDRVTLGVLAGFVLIVSGFALSERRLFRELIGYRQ